ncbi:MAG: T9SS type A sorting domain-containing protein [Saprospiraceae bacterium]
MNKYQLCVSILFLYISFSNAQKVWIRCSNGLPADTGILSLANIGSVLFAGTEKAGVFRSKDGGNSWQEIPLDPLQKKTQSWSMCSLDTFLIVGQRGGGILRTSINGSHWELLNSGIGRKVLQDIISVGKVIYAASFGGGVYVSYDTARTWSILYNNEGMDDLKALSLANNSKYLFAGSAGINTTMPDTGVAFVTPLNGNSWELINNGFVRNGAHLEAVLSIEANDSLVFAGTDDVGIFRSTDNGQLWHQAVGTNLNGDVYSIAISGNQVFYGTTYGGIYSSDDYGMTFTANNIGLRLGNATLPFLVKDLLILGDTIYAATDLGVYKQALSSITKTNNESSEQTKKPFVIYPNPSNGILQFDFLVSSPNDCQILITNILSNVTVRFNKDIFLNGKQHAELDLTDLPNGIYILQIKQEEWASACKFILNK